MNTQHLTTAHLTTAQLDDLLFNPNAAASEHLAACPACSAELASLRATFGDLRSGATLAAARHQQIAPNPRVSTIPTRLIGSFATAALALTIGLPIALHRHPAAPPAVAANTPQAAPAPASSLTDEQLLNSVQGDLAASVPDPMLPLESASSTSTTSHAN